MKMSYSEKLQDPRWQRKRLEVLSRENFTCQSCGDTKETLHVHHLAYHGDPWETPADFLECLCASCHEIRTDMERMFGRTVAPTWLYVIVGRTLAQITNDDVVALKKGAKKIGQRYFEFLRRRQRERYGAHPSNHPDSTLSP